MERKWISALFVRFQARWAHKWTSAIEGIESVAVQEWSEGLGEMTPEQITRGLEATKNNDWPPSLGEFRKACLGLTDESGGDPHYCQMHLGENRPPIDPSKTLPARNRTPTTVKQVEKHLSNLKGALRSKG